MTIKNLLILISVCMLIACDWVDSTGRESNSTPVAEISFAGEQSSDASIISDSSIMNDTTAINELETLELTVSATDADGEVNRYKWQTEPLEQGALSQCAGVADFEMQWAADSLETACTSATNCVVTFEQQADDGGIEANGAIGDKDVLFKVKAPELSAPVGVTYQLETVDNEGGIGTQQSTFCFIAINEAPDAQDDIFTVREGQVLTVPSELSPANLLTNDEQDDHVANEDLRVLPTPLRAPSRQVPGSFALNANGDGGFTYTARMLEDQSTETEVDTFVYSVTDGTHDSFATVTVKVVATNDPPEQEEEIPLQEIIAGVEYKSDLSKYFMDPEGNTLTFTPSGGALPASGTLSLSATGKLSGTVEQIEAGSYSIEITVSDGNARIGAELDIVVAENMPVEEDSIPVQQNELGELFDLDLSEFFTDPESSPLTYSVQNPYNSAIIYMDGKTGEDVDGKTGEFEARFSAEGLYTFRVVASDGVTAPVNTILEIEVSSENTAPEFSGTIVNQTARVGRVFQTVNVRTEFSDADGDDLVYSVIGTLPEGIDLTTTGLLFGTPTEAGTFRNIRVKATDPSKEFAISDAFQFQVSRAFGTRP